MEDVLSIYEKEKPLGVIAQFGGQTPLNLAADLEEKWSQYPWNFAGRSLIWQKTVICSAAMMEKLNIPMPEAGMAVDVEDALEIAE